MHSNVQLVDDSFGTSSQCRSVCSRDSNNNNDARSSFVYVSAGFRGGATVLATTILQSRVHYRTFIYFLATASITGYFPDLKKTIF